MRETNQIEKQILFLTELNERFERLAWRTKDEKTATLLFAEMRVVAKKIEELKNLIKKIGGK